MDQITDRRTTGVHLGIPTFSQAAGRASTATPQHAAAENISRHNPTIS